MSRNVGFMFALLIWASIGFAEGTGSEYDSIPNLDEIISTDHSEPTQGDSSNNDGRENKIDPCKRVHKLDIKQGAGCKKYPHLVRAKDFTQPGVYYTGCYQVVPSSDGAEMIRLPSLREGTTWTLVKDGVKTVLKAGETLGAQDFFGKMFPHIAGAFRLARLASQDNFVRQMWVPISATCGMNTCPTPEKREGFAHLKTK